MQISYPLLAYQLIEADPLAVDIATGRVRIPLRVVRTPFEFYGFPPALVPIWSDSSGPSYVGYWKHWFVHRNTTIAECFVEDGFRTTEYARNLRQAGYIIAAQYISINGRVDEEVLQFAQAVGLDHIEELARIVVEHGDDVAALRVLPEFANDLPLNASSKVAPYHGDYPHELMAISPGALEKVSALELPGKVQQKFRSAIGVPPWLATNDQPAVFSQCLEEDNLRGAWLSLNSTGWTFPEARKAIEALAEQSHDVRFAQFSTVWLSCPHETVCVGY